VIQLSVLFPINLENNLTEDILSVITATPESLAPELNIELKNAN
jgi:hypothetical protein